MSVCSFRVRAGGRNFRIVRADVLPGLARAWGGSGCGSGTAWFSRGGGEQAVAAWLVSEWVRGFDSQPTPRTAWTDVGLGQHPSSG